VNYIRTRFDDVRVIVPLGAMSAATMMACAANTIVLGKHSYLGPTDPQLILETPLGVRAVPAHAIVAQFRLAQSEAANPAQFGAWIPMLQQYGPALIVQCNNVMALGTSMVKDWLERWMFKGDAGASAKANLAATALNDHALHMVHDRFLNRDFLKGLGLKIEDLEKDQAFQDAVLTVFHAVTHTFQFNGTVTKIVENHLGKAFMSKRAPPPMAAMLPFPVAPPPPQRP
jgi:serine dehydrogenase proteinase